MPNQQYITIEIKVDDKRCLGCYPEEMKKQLNTPDKILYLCKKHFDAFKERFEKND